MRIVIENGNYFTKDNLYTMLAQIEAEFIDLTLARYLKILFEEMEVTQFEFNDFVYNLQTTEL